LSEDRSFSDAGIMGTKRWVERIYKLANSNEKIKEVSESKEFLQKLHQSIQQISYDFEQLKYNTVIAKLMELTNAIAAEKTISQDSWEKYIVMLSPFLPFLAEELWTSLGHKESIFTATWPQFDEQLAKSDTIEFVISINGKVRDKMQVSADITEDDAKKLLAESEKSQKRMEGKEVVKMIFVKGKMLNVVVKE
jgi:leucyl-tRNA synthetase